MNANVVALLDAQAARVPDRAALIEPHGTGSRTTTFAQLRHRTERIAAGLCARGLRPGDRVLCLVPMSADLYALLLGLLRGGGVATFVDPWVGRARIAAFAAFAEPRGFAGVPRAHWLRLASAALRRIPLAITTGRRWWRWPAPCTLAELEHAPAEPGAAPVAPDTPALVTFTTGSGGLPKGANRTHGFLRAQHATLAAAFPYVDDDVDCTAFPVFALNNLALGLTTVIPPVDFGRVADADPERLADTCRAHGVRTATLSPPLVDRLAEATAPPPLRRLLTGGGPIQDAQLRRWQAAFPGTAIVCAYGSTEVEPVAHCSAGERLAAHAAGQADGLCLGTPVAGLAVRVLRIHDGPIVCGPRGLAEWEVAPGQVGEFVVAGAHVGRDYFRNPDADRACKVVAGDTVWHRMGDTGWQDSGGRLWLAGRVPTTIRRHGAELHAQAIEAAAGRLAPEARQVAAVGLPGAGPGQRLALVVRGPLAAATPARLREGLAARGWSPDELHVVEGPLPVDPRHNTKVDTEALRDRLRRGTLR